MKLLSCCLLVLAALGLTACGPPTPPPRDLGAAELLSISLGAAPDHGIVAMAASGAGEATWLYRAPNGSEVRQFALARDESFLIYSFVPPPGPDAKLYDRSALYRADLSSPAEWQSQPLLGGQTPGEYLLEPALSPDGRYCFFVRVAQSDDALNAYSDITLQRLDLRSGEVIDIIDNGIWPTVSPDGRRIAFVGVQPLSQQRGLFVSTLDGGDLTMVVPVGRYFDIDAPAFTPDGRHVVFAVAEEDTRVPAGRSMSWLWRLLPIGAALAHNDHDVPSDWWRVAVTGGDAERLTEADKIMSYGAFSGGDDTFAYATTDGIYLTDFQGDVQLVRRGGVWMSLAWRGGR